MKSKNSENIDKIIYNLKIWSKLPLSFPETRKGYIAKGILDCVKNESTMLAFKILYEDYSVMRAGIKFLYKELKKVVEDIIKTQINTET
jgi:hypothetical protein